MWFSYSVCFLPSSAFAAAIPGTVSHDAGRKLITMADGEKNLVLRLNYDGRCMLDQVIVRGREVVASATGVCSGIKVAGQWYTTRSVPTPKVTVEGNGVMVENIRLKGGGVESGRNLGLRCFPRPYSLGGSAGMLLGRHAGRRLLSRL